MLTKGDLKEIEKIINPLKEDLGEVKETVGANNGSLIKIENTIGVYSDALDIERKRIDRQDGRLEVVEETLNLKPPI